MRGWTLELEFGLFMVGPTGLTGPLFESAGCLKTCGMTLDKTSQ